MATRRNKQQQLFDDGVLRLSPRVCVSPGDRIRVSGGPTIAGRPFCERGLFGVVAVIVKRTRVYLDCVRISTEDGSPSGRFCLFVQGKPYRRADLPGVTWRPFKIKKCRGANT